METAAFVWDLEAAIDNVVCFYAAKKLRKEGFYTIDMMTRAYWRRRSQIYSQAYSEVKDEISALVSENMDWVAEFSYTYTEDKSGGFTVVAESDEWALQRANWLKSRITGILRKKYRNFVPYVHEIHGADAKEPNELTQTTVDSS